MTSESEAVSMGIRIVNASAAPRRSGSSMFSMVHGWNRAAYSMLLCLNVIDEWFRRREGWWLGSLLRAFIGRSFFLR